MTAEIANPGDFAVALCRSLGAPVTQSNVQFIIAWAHVEGGNWNNAAHFNPLNTTLDLPGATSMNSVGVKAYTSWDQGIAATAATLRNGRYDDIVAALQGGDASVAAASSQGLRTWSGGGYGTVIEAIPGAGPAARQAIAAAGASTTLVSSLMLAPASATGLDPAELTDLARILEMRADASAGLVQQLADALGAAAWAGPSADAFRADATDLAGVMNRDADGLRLAAADLRKLADDLQQELGVLRAVEDKVRAWFAANPPGMRPVPAPWAESDLPPTGDPRWRDVQRAFATIGVL